MLKNIIIVTILSVLVILFMPWAQKSLLYLVSVHDWINEHLKEIFSVGQAGTIIRQLISLLAVPLLFSLIPILIYWLAKHSWLPWTPHVIWVIWLIETSAIVLLYAPPPK